MKDWNDAHQRGVNARETADAAWSKPVPPAKPTKGFDWRANVITAAELQTQQFPSIKYVVPGLIPEGLSILAGRPKLGKSWAALDIALAVSTDGYCFGDRKPLHGDVLYAALEDNRRRLKNRTWKVLEDRGCKWPAHLTFATRWRALDEGGVDDAKAWAETVANPVLVIFDTLAHVRPQRKTSDTLYDGDYKALTELHAWANETGLAVIVLHHTRKMDAEDPLDAVSGSLGTVGCADTTLILSRNNQGTTLYVRGRDIEEAEHAINFSRESCRWTILGDVADIRLSDTRKTILDFLRAASDPKSPNDIAAATGLKKNVVDQQLYQMLQKGDVSRPSKGKYIHPDRDDLISGEEA